MIIYSDQIDPAFLTFNTLWQYADADPIRTIRNQVTPQVREQLWGHVWDMVAETLGSTGQYIDQ